MLLERQPEVVAVLPALLEVLAVDRGGCKPNRAGGAGSGAGGIGHGGGNATGAG